MGAHTDRYDCAGRSRKAVPGEGFHAFEDLLDNNFVSSNFMQLNLGANFSLGGLAYEQDPVTPVPLPPALPMMIAGLGAFAFMRRLAGAR